MSVENETTDLELNDNQSRTLQERNYENRCQTKSSISGTRILLLPSCVYMLRRASYSHCKNKGRSVINFLPLLFFIFDNHHHDRWSDYIMCSPPAHTEYIKRHNDDSDDITHEYQWTTIGISTHESERTTIIRPWFTSYQKRQLQPNSLRCSQSIRLTDY